MDVQVTSTFDEQIMSKYYIQITSFLVICSQYPFVRMFNIYIIQEFLYKGTNYQHEQWVSKREQKGVLKNYENNGKENYRGNYNAAVEVVTHF